jgi:hypothetical protein
MATFIDMLRVHFEPGMRVRATRLIVEGDVAPDPDAERCAPGWVHARHGDLGRVESIGPHDVPSVKFDRTGTETMVSELEVEPVPTRELPALPDRLASPERVEAVVVEVHEGAGSIAELARRLGAPRRAVREAVETALALGLIQTPERTVRPTWSGSQFWTENAETRRAIVAGALANRPVFAEGLRHIEWTGALPDVDRVAGWLAPDDASARPRRRDAERVIDWLRWLTALAAPSPSPAPVAFDDQGPRRDRPEAP